MGFSTASCIHRWQTSATWTTAMWSSCVWTSLYQAIETFWRGGTRGKTVLQGNDNSTQTFSKWTLLRDLVGWVHATCGLMNQPLIFTEGNPDHPRMWKWLTGHRTGYPQIELKPGGASITVTGALESLEVVLELWGGRTCNSMRANNVVVAWCTPSTDLVLQSSSVDMFHDSGELKTLNEWKSMFQVHKLDHHYPRVIFLWVTFPHRFQSSWIFAARRGGVAGGSCCTPVGCLPCGVETRSFGVLFFLCDRDMYVLPC